ncbi:hypothetical protein BO1005MUT1_500026 [Hyphomicrobiales bacterium]|nr:hypothetical protein BO1005MUT1_500026 [Hyphomicrobiales bacterium]
MPTREIVHSVAEEAARSTARSGRKVSFLHKKHLVPISCQMLGRASAVRSSTNNEYVVALTLKGAERNPNSFCLFAGEVGLMTLNHAFQSKCSLRIRRPRQSA